MKAAQSKSRPWLAFASLALYFPLFIGLHQLIGNSALVIIFLPTVTFAVHISRNLGIALSFLLVAPNYYLFTWLGEMQDGAEALIELLTAHVAIAVLTFFVGNAFTLRRQLAEELFRREVEEARFRALFDHTNDAILMLNLDLQIQAANPQAAALLGYTVDELIGMDHRVIVPSQEHANLRERLKVLMDGGELPLYERTYKRRDGKLVPVEVSASLIFDSQGNPHHVQSISRDISSRRATEEQLRYQAMHDSLTGVFGRNMFVDLLNEAVKRARRRGENIALLFIDLDGFKEVNDTHGHSMGDWLLQSVAQRLKATVRGSDAVSRVGGDEFTIILEDVPSREIAQLVAGKVEEALNEPYDNDGVVAEVAASIGVALFPEDGKNPDELLKRADAAMYEVKKAKPAPKPRKRN